MKFQSVYKNCIRVNKIIKMSTLINITYISRYSKIKMACPLCKHDFSTNKKCGTRLFNSTNTCPICLENKSIMVALPCGHQFCKEDLQKIGLQIKPFAQVPTTTRRLRFQRRVLFRRRTPRCSWCSHIGHTIRKCDAHRRECSCTTFNTDFHKQKHLQKRKCSYCRKRGHISSTCFRYIRGI